jgi:hypothetical protein
MKPPSCFKVRSLSQEEAQFFSYCEWLMFEWLQAVLCDAVLIQGLYI